MKLNKNTILITGGTSGIGLALAKQLHRLGNKVIITGRRRERLDAITKEHPGMIAIQSDISDAAARESLSQLITAQHPATNVLINNAGVQYTFDLKKSVDLKKLNDEIGTNLIAPIHLTSLLAPHLAAQPGATVINISSGLAFVPLAFLAVYCATKAALHSWTLSLRHQFLSAGIKVFEIIPPSVDTELGHDRRPDKTQTHGGIHVDEFIRETMEALAQDKIEAPIAGAKGLRAKGEEMFGMLNK